MKEPTTSDTTPKKKILVVDDLVEIRTMTAAMLERIGYEVTTASNGREGLQIAVESEPDLIISDISMPELDGIKMGQALRRGNLDVPILYVSSSLRIPTYMADVQTITPHYLHKPALARQLTEKVAEILAQAA
ncbi:MAG TPA: response regulator [Candidatus Paceibacterota bacterium]